MFEFMRPWIKKSKLCGRDLIDSENYPAPYSIYAEGFLPCSSDVIDLAERDLKQVLPEQLRFFYSECGVGQAVFDRRESFFSDNNVLIPTHIPRLLDGSCAWMSPFASIEPDVIPFFERDVDLFLCLKPKSENPNAVWWMWGEGMYGNGKICDSVIEFFEKLVDDPDWFNPSKI